MIAHRSWHRRRPWYQRYRVEIGFAILMGGFALGYVALCAWLWGDLR